MAEDYPPRMYWHYARRNRVKAKFYSPYRAIPAVLVLSVQFIWKHKSHTPFTEMWIAIAIIIFAYLAIFILESLWNFTVLTPPKIYGEQVDIIGELTAQNSFLESKLRGPTISPQEQRRRELVSEKMKGLGEVGRNILRCIHDQGEVHALALEAEHSFNSLALNNFFAKAVPGGLILYQNHIVRIKPELKSALEFVLSTDYDKDLKD
jgi:hypothetical protein